MMGTLYLGALRAAEEMALAAGDASAAQEYRKLFERGSRALDRLLWNGEYYIQRYDEKQHPKYQFGEGCLSDQLLGEWLASVLGLGPLLPEAHVGQALASIYRYNFRNGFHDFPNPQRIYALNDEKGLLLCSWPKGKRPALPFVYADEVWTGIEYQVASHLMMLGLVEEGLEIVRACRDRYDGRVRNPFNEYECGHWYARAMSSYALLAGLTGARYDALEKTLHLEPRLEGDFRGFLSTATGYGTVGVKGGKPFLEVKAGKIDVERIAFQPRAG
jgi:hypothetical protein